MSRRAPVLLIVLALALSALVTTSGSANARRVVDRDCGDFATQKAAQLFFLDHSPRTDPHRLDADGDGIACDANPCTCYYGTSGSGGTASTTSRKTVIQYGRVVRVVDGDTVDVRLKAGKRRVRLLGIDTPEVYGGVECGGPAASAALKRMLPVGVRVRLVSDTTQANKDRYGRLLRYVARTSNGRQVNRAQVYLGNATVYVYNNVPFKRVTSFRAAQAAAKAAPRGIWKRC